MMDLLSKYIDLECSKIVSTTTMQSYARLSPKKPCFSLVSEFGLQTLTFDKEHFSLGVFSCHK